MNRLKTSIINYHGVHGVSRRKKSLRTKTSVFLRVLCGLLFLLIYNVSFAQSAPYLIPRHIYVGDPAVLIVPLPVSNQNYPDIVLTDDLLPLDEYIDFQRIILERRISGSRLIVEFTAFAAGVLEFPVIEIGEETFPALSVTVNSILSGRADRTLSGNASTLAMPGTALMLYGTIALFAVIILLSIWFAVKGKIIFNKLYDKWKRKRLFTHIRKTEKRLRKLAAKGSKREILDKLSDETRNFLTVLTGNNFRAMTAGEFESLPEDKIVLKQTGLKQAELKEFANFFRSCDELRFSGAQINLQDILKLLDDLRRNVNTLMVITRKSAKEQK
ncbi:MAG: hypothetical protein FWD47_03820 [Treponema sp.]|nr:hypothetical protein [Treponema sp.]